MKRIKVIFLTTLISFLGFHGVQAQNTLLDRTFWKANPSIEEVQAEIALGNDATELNEHAFDPTGYAILEKVDNATIQYLLGLKGNGVNKRTHDGRTYIFWAAYRDNLELMKHLVGMGADPGIIDSHGYSLLNFAATTGQQRTALYDYIISLGADVKNEKNREGANALLLLAPFMKDMTLLDYFVNKGLSIDSQDTAGLGIFQYAAKGGNLKMLQALVEKGIDFKNVTKDGVDAMHMASRGRRGHQNPLETYQYLEKLGLSPKSIDNKGRTPLHHLAYSTQDTSVFKYFLSKGITVDQADSEGNTPFLNAAFRNDLEVVRYLASLSKNIDQQDKEGRSALTRALERNTDEVVSLLLEQGASVDITDVQGNRPSYYLLNSFAPHTSGEFDTKLRLLTKHGCNMAQPQENGNTLYHLAVEKNDLALLKKLQKMKLPINAKNKEGNTALHIAAMKSENDAILKFLLEQGADKSAKTAFDESALDLASENELLKKNNVELIFLR